MKITIKTVTCPRCKCEEVEDNSLPIMQQKLQIRGFKVHHSGSWWSQCLLCKAAGLPSWFNKRGQFEEPRT